MSQYLTSLGQITKENVILALRHYFQVTSDFGTINSTIKAPFIREAYGQSVRNYPAIFVKIVNCSTTPLGIGKNFVKDVMSDDQQVAQEFLPGTEHWQKPVAYKRRVIAERYGTMANIQFNLEIWGDNTYVRNNLVDQTIAAFDRFEKQNLMDKGILIVSISEGQESDFPLNDSEHIYTANISLTVNAEKYYDLPVASITAVDVQTTYIPAVFPDVIPYNKGNTLADDQ